MSDEATVVGRTLGEEVLAVRGVSKWFGDACVLDRIDLSLRAGEVVG